MSEKAAPESVVNTPHRLYLAGPMSGYAEHNYPLFNRVAQALRSRGHQVFNPAENKDAGLSRPRSFYMQLDIPALIESDGLVALPGWRESRGANLEMWLALDLDIPAYKCTPLEGGSIALAPLGELQPFPWPFSRKARCPECGKKLGATAMRSPDSIGSTPQTLRTQRHTNIRGG